MLNDRKLWFRVGWCLLFLGAALVLLSPYKQYCEADYADQKYCAAYEITSAFGGFLEAHNGAVTALATIAIAWFTWTLKIANEGMLKVTGESVKLARDEFLSSHRPKVRIKHIWLMSQFHYDAPVNIKVVCVNIGTTDARLIDYGADFFVVGDSSKLPPDPKFAFERQISTILKPGISGPFPDFSYALSEEIEKSIRFGTKKFYCAGYLHYLDNAGHPRTTAFCRELALHTHGGGGRFMKIDHPDYEYED